MLGAARLAFEKYGVEPPEIVKMEMEIEREKLALSAGDLDPNGAFAGSPASESDGNTADKGGNEGGKDEYVEGTAARVLPPRLTRNLATEIPVRTRS